MEFLIYHKKLKIIAMLMVIILMLGPSSQAMAQDSNKLKLYEQTIKAGLVYNFLKYTTWPTESEQSNHLRVCLFGGDSLDGNLAQLQGRMAQQSLISVLHVENISGTANCDLVFVNRDKRDAMPELLTFLQDRHVLTISDMAQFATIGGMVELTMEDRRVALYINKKAVNRAGLSIQDRLLKLAKEISG
jgi:hypothetical protein